jgi:squalene cyclase
MITYPVGVVALEAGVMVMTTEPSAVWTTEAAVAWLAASSAFAWGRKKAELSILSARIFQLSHSMVAIL